MQNPEFTLVVPLWNEGKNVESLVKMIDESGLHDKGMAKLVLVNNGSVDETASLIDESAEKYQWICPVHLDENQNYGGGVYEGCKYAETQFVGYIPGDMQVSADDVIKVWQTLLDEYKRTENSEIFVKGHRTRRFDGKSMQFVSNVFTMLGNIIVGLGVKDVNGLPKIFDISLLDKVPEERMINFVFDTQIISLARKHKWNIVEVPVTFHARREGVSSWSGKRIKTYITVLGQLFKLRTLKNEEGIPLKRQK